MRVSRLALPQDETIRKIVSSLPGVVFQFVTRPEEKGTFSFLSEGVEELFGLKPEEIYQNPGIIDGLLHPADKKEYRETLLNAFERLIPWSVKFRIITPQGREKWVQGTAKPLQMTQGGVLWNGMMVEIYVPEIEPAAHFTTHDQLTGLFNRAYFEKEIIRLEKDNSDTAIILCDIDGLKMINDSFGHSEGDKFLIASARIIQDTLRDGDIVARIGGDEFAAILPGVTEQVAENICRTIRERVIEHELNSFQLSFSISVGFAVSSKGKKSLTEVFRAAEDNMGREKLHHSGSMRSKIIQALGTALEARDYITDGHATRLQGMALMLAMAAGLPENKYGDLRLLARFHDIGKVAIPDEILFKPGPLSPDEMEIMRKHCEIGHRLALALPDLAPIADWILKHHEWWNGCGYPLRISGEKIPLECRIIGIVDAYDSMINDRPYRPAMTNREAIKQLRKNSGTQFDSTLVNQFIALLEGHFS